ncbi:MAG: hypothetical protein ACK40G_12465 [Cytophagaceae bacterium]
MFAIIFYSTRRSFLHLTLGIFLLSATINSSYSQETYHYPKQEGSKWGIVMNAQVYTKGKLEYQEKWKHKPIWDMVWIDSVRYGCLTKRNCDGFITLKNGKYGYIWTNGNKLDNQYDHMAISRRVAKKNNHWGGFREHIQVLPFEYDSLVYNSFAIEYKNRDTSFMGYAGRKNGKWNLILVKLVNEIPVGNVEVLSSPASDMYFYDFGIIVCQNSRWSFVDLRIKGKPVYSASYDSIKVVGLDYAVKKQDKWYLASIHNPNIPVGRGWDRLEVSESLSYFKVWENGKVGILSLENNFLKEVIKPSGTFAKVVWRKEKNDVVFEISQDGKILVYDKNQNLLSSSGDISVVSSKIAGPFRIDQHETYGHYSVYDAKTNELLIPKGKMHFYYHNDPEMGHILKIQELWYSDIWRHGFFHYGTKTYIKPEYTKEFQSIGSSYLINGIYGDGGYHLWEKKTMKQLQIPFKVKEYKNEFQYLISDEGGQWHQIDEKFTIVDPSKVIVSRNTYVGGIEIEKTIDDGITLLRLNGKEVNSRVEYFTSDINGKLCAIKNAGHKKEYFEKEGKAEECNYKLSPGIKVLEIILSDNPWPGTNYKFPAIIADSANRIVIVNMHNNKRMVLPLTLTPNGILQDASLYEGSEISVCNASSYDSFFFCGKKSKVCKNCKNGYIQKQIKEVIPGGVTYTTRKTYNNKESFESKWDPGTNSYKSVKVSKPEVGYETIENKEPDRVVEKTVNIKCDMCNGTQVIITNQEIEWDGKTLKTK